MPIPGWNGGSVRQHYKDMLDKKSIQEVNIENTNPFGDLTRITFLPENEEILASIIEGSFIDGIQMGIAFIKDEAVESHTNFSVKISAKIFESPEKTKYTNEFKLECHQRKESFIKEHNNMLKYIEEA